MIDVSCYKELNEYSVKITSNGKGHMRVLKLIFLLRSPRLLYGVSFKFTIFVYLICCIIKNTMAFYSEFLKIFIYSFYIGIF